MDGRGFFTPDFPDLLHVVTALFQSAEKEEEPERAPTPPADTEPAPPAETEPAPPADTESTPPPEKEEEVRYRMSNTGS